MRLRRSEWGGWAAGVLFARADDAVGISWDLLKTSWDLLGVQEGLFPSILGHEAGAVVESVGEGVRFRLLYSPCSKCRLSSSMMALIISVTPCGFASSSSDASSSSPSPPLTPPPPPPPSPPPLPPPPPLTHTEYLGAIPRHSRQQLARLSPA